MDYNDHKKFSTTGSKNHVANYKKQGLSTRDVIIKELNEMLDLQKCGNKYDKAVLEYIDIYGNNFNISKRVFIDENN